MFLEGSRYERARPFGAEPGSAVPFPGVQAREVAPAVAVLEHTVQAGDRLDRLARHYYDDDRLWWRIADANPQVFYAGDLVREEDDELPVAGGTLALERMIGHVILIPRARG
jgi:nucleoid-associated protein YgaU